MATPPAPPSPKAKDAEEQPEESGIESVRSKLHQALALIVDATNELDDLEQQGKRGT